MSWFPKSVLQVVFLDVSKGERNTRVYTVLYIIKINLSGKIKPLIEI